MRASDFLAPTWKTAMRSYFPKALLDTVKAITLGGARIPPPPFYSEAVAMSGGHFPDFVHLASVTYIDVIVFNDTIAPRTLFHGLVHAQQMAALGLDTYVGFYLRGFLKTRSWITIPLEAQAFQLEARFSLYSPRSLFRGRRNQLLDSRPALLAGMFGIPQIQRNGKGEPREPVGRRPGLRG